MKKQSVILQFLRYEGKILLLTFFLILVTGCITWNTFFRTPAPSQIRRDYLVEDIASELSLDTKRIENYNDIQLEIISRLDLNGLIALERYPQATERVYQELKDYQLFYDVVDEFGPHHIIPVLDYFYDEGNLAITLQEKISNIVNSFFRKSEEKDSLSGRQKRLLAVLNEIQYQKHNFLARFIFTEKGAKRNYVTTTTSTLVNFFTGGLANLNNAIVTRGISQVTTTELVDAGIDVLILIPFVAWLTRSAKTSLTALRGSRVVAITEKSALKQGARTTAKTTRFARISRFSKTIWRTIPLRTLFKFKYVKWYILALAIYKPDLINHAAALVADAISVPRILIKTGVWFLILFPILNLIIPVFLFIRYFWKRLFKKRNLLLHEAS